ncbi:flagellar biosynthesis protein FlhF [Halobacillus andaensis]|uniref:Flagellar biosynthesis protein FlhF n=1 Tax=Halobacillus andaensis TaxID=1176239 RepID=A0A917ETD6_HALAA|nr:flagellar biosynthesis protein FlhF [Halobacillus andaensis]MBP2003477.1 flagellar biosynthesis protein FlhF [Halobacillus andaensis]GGF10915.1 flagellar biosynthesis protein FlhF [Halobacillus andaensis]
MKVKKFQAPSMPEAMNKVKKNLGTDAVILNSKEIKVGGFLGMFKKPQIEVIAAIDPTEESEKKRKKQTLQPAPSVQRSADLSLENNEVMKELKQLKTLVQQQTSHEEKQTLIQQMAVYLKDQELDQSFVDELIQSIVLDGRAEEITENQLKKLVKSNLCQALPPAAERKQGFSKKYIHLVGPTGVGKTTTIAKLASDAVINRNESVAFITTDTYRMAAVDQLKTYAKLLDVPLEVAYTIEDYRKAREKLKAYDLVFIDTAGRNFKDAYYVRELTKMIEFNEDTETYLVLSLTSKYADMKEIFYSFNQVPMKSLIFTKKDETSKIGGALSLSILHQIGIAYITFGQDVPDDIEYANAFKLVETIMGDYSNE